MSVPVKATISGRPGKRPRKRRIESALRQACSATIRSAPAPSQANCTLTRWPSSLSRRAQRSAVARLPARALFLAGVIRITFMTELSEAGPMTEPVSVDHLRTIMRDARARTLELVEGLDGDQVMGPKLTIVNPLRWEIGHVAWFQEKFILRDLYGHAPIHPPSDAIYDSIAIAHDTRWDLPLLSMSGTLGYMENVLEACLDRLPGGMASAQDSYIYQFATFHEDMHTEAYTYTRQTLGYPEPRFANVERPADADAGALPGDAAVPGGELRLGAEEDASLVFDNEKWRMPSASPPSRLPRPR